jgi:hypothetical protein
MPTHIASFILNDASVTVKVVEGSFDTGKYTNPYPFPLNFQVVDTNPPKGEKFFFTLVMKPMKFDEPFAAARGINTEGLYAKIALARS